MLYFVPAVDLADDAWIDGFLFHHTRRHVPDALETRIRDVLAAGGRMTALRELRRLAPAFDLERARGYVDALENRAAPPRVLPPPSIQVGQLDPPTAGLNEYAHMWTTDRDQWYLSTLPGHVAIPIHRVHRGAEESALVICDDRLAAAVVAHMAEAGVEMVARALVPPNPAQ
ncbi:hypothetical protein [Streptodolium elevatio]|uniref:Uncharacterized protein n=1 Tax=Streptodolium elevatio TaxID=3157996 RepID=A0ABV3DJ98_9ACTN